jgi:tRNA synthetases class I (E and Q), anti-codon binding domain.
LTDVIYIDSTDFRLEDNSMYYGLAPNKAVGLKYFGGNLVCDEVVSTNGEGKVTELKCHLDTSENRAKPKSWITWVPNDGIRCEVRVYGHLFVVPEPTDRWEEELNDKSEVVYPHAIVDPSVKEYVDVKHVNKWHSNPALQFERVGYFVVDVDTTFDSKTGQGALVFNRTVSLKEETFKKELTPEEIAKIEARKAKNKADLEAKEAKMKISVKDLFRLAPEYKGMYSQFNEDGIPTHMADGSEVSKSAMKKLAKDQKKHEKALASWAKSNR